LVETASVVPMTVGVLLWLGLAGEVDVMTGACGNAGFVVKCETLP
jgi:hypothetical protein